MKKRWRWLLALLLFAVFVVGLEPTRVMWGWLRGEAFYDGRPTSYWRRELGEWHLILARTNQQKQTTTILNQQRFDAKKLEDEGFEATFVRKQGWLRGAWNSVFDGTSWDLHSVKTDEPPSLLRGDPDSEPVLDALDGQAAHGVQLLVDYGRYRLQKARDP